MSAGSSCYPWPSASSLHARYCPSCGGLHLRLYEWPVDGEGALLAEVRIPDDEFLERNLLRWSRALYVASRDLCADELEGVSRLPLEL